MLLLTLLMMVVHLFATRSIVEQIKCFQESCDHFGGSVASFEKVEVWKVAMIVEHVDVHVGESTDSVV